MRIVTSLAAVIALGCMTPAVASEIEQGEAGTVHRLAPQEVEALKENAAQRNRGTPSTAIGDLDINDPPGAPKIHGEVGFGIGTGGYTSVFGAAVMPLGQNGSAAFSFERSDFGNRRYRYRR